MSKKHAVKLYRDAQIARAAAAEAAYRAEMVQFAAESHLDSLHDTYQFLVPVSELYTTEDGLTWSLRLYTSSRYTDSVPCSMVYIDNKVCVYSTANVALRRFYAMPKDRALWPERLLKVQQYFSKYLLNHLYPDKPFQLCLNTVLPNTTLVTWLETAPVPAAETLATTCRKLTSDVTELTQRLTHAEKLLLIATTHEELLNKKRTGEPLSSDFLNKWGKYTRGKGC